MEKFMINTCEADILNYRHGFFLKSERDFFGFSRDRDLLIRSKIKSVKSFEEFQNFLSNIKVEYKIAYSVLNKLRYPRANVPIIFWPEKE